MPVELVRTVGAEDFDWLQTTAEISTVIAVSKTTFLRKYFIPYLRVRFVMARKNILLLARTADVQFNFDYLLPIKAVMTFEPKAFFLHCSDK